MRAEHPTQRRRGRQPRHAHRPGVAARFGRVAGAKRGGLSQHPQAGQPVAPRNCAGRGAGEGGNRATGIGPALPPDSVGLVAQSEAGYRNILKLVGRSHPESAPGEAPQLDLAALDGHPDGLICLAGGPKGPVGRLIGEGQATAAEAILTRLAELFPGRLYVELQRHNTAIEERIDAALIELALARDLPLVATNDVHFAERDDYNAHDVLLCIAQGTTIADGNRKRLTPEHYFKSANEMRIAFADVPEACDNTLVIAQRCAFMPEPRQPILPPFKGASGRDEVAELRDAAAAGLERRLARALPADLDAAQREAAAAPYRERLAFELDVIVKMGF